MRSGDGAGSAGRERGAAMSGPIREVAGDVLGMTPKALYICAVRSGRDPLDLLRDALQRRRHDVEEVRTHNLAQRQQLAVRQRRDALGSA